MSERPLSAEGTRFAIAAPHFEATRAGLAAFDAGGNAIDAALAAAVTLAVVYPMACGVGGDLFALVQQPDGRVTALNASGAAPLEMDLDALRRLGDDMPERGPFTITVPGAVSGWQALHRLGAALPWELAFGPAIGFARDGVAVASSLALSLAEDEDLLADPGLRGVFTHDGRALREGEPLLQPALAQTLEVLAAEGSSALYGGEVGRAYAEGIRAAGSPMRVDDLAAHEAELVAALIGAYRDLHVRVVPPNSQGFVLLQILAAVERLGLDPDPLGPDAATLAEIARACALDRDRHNADPRRAHVPFESLIDDGHIAAICDLVTSGRTLPDAPTTPVAGDTIALVTADAEGHAVSLIQSLASGFGSGILEPATGIIGHNRGAQFSLDPASPNRLEGGKRPAHTLMPVLVHRDGQLAAVGGTMGGGGQPQINAMSLIRTFDLRLSPAETLRAPRWLAGGMELGLAEKTIDLESSVPAPVADAFRRAGFRLVLRGEMDDWLGHAHLIVVKPDGALAVATDPRADGEAAAR